MSFFKLIFAYWRFRPGMVLLTSLLLAIATGLAVLVLSMSEQLDAGLKRDARNIDLVVGAKGSPLQLVLSGVYHLDVPPGNIALESLKQLTEGTMNKTLIRQVVPISIGDSFQGYRIVGTSLSFFEVYGAELASGKLNNAEMSVVLGSEVANAAKLQVGSKFLGQHGLAPGGSEHSEHVYEVAGILQPTGRVIDRLIVASLESVWLVHEGKNLDVEEKKLLEENREVSMGLIQFKSPLAAATLPRRINASNDLQAASPAAESARLIGLARPIQAIIQAGAVVMLLLSALSVFLALSKVLSERRSEIALTRLLGGGRSKVLRLLLLEAFLMSLLGAILGVFLAQLLLSVLPSLTQSWGMVGPGASGALPLPANVWSTSTAFVVGAALVLGLLSACLPAWRASRLSVNELIETSN